MRRNITVSSTILLLCFLLFSCSPIQNTDSGQKVRPTPVPQYSIPTQGEYADDTTFYNSGFILSYQIVNNVALADMTEVYAYCKVDYSQDGYPNILHVDSVETSVTMNVNGNSITIQGDIPYDANNPLSSASLSFVGKYTNDTFILTSSTITSKENTGPATFTFTDMTRKDALSVLKKAYQKMNTCSSTPTPAPTPTPVPLFIFHGNGNASPSFHASSTWVPQWSCTGNANITIQVKDGDTSQGTSNTVPCDGSLDTEWTFPQCSGSYQIKVTTQGNWTLFIEPIVPLTGITC